MQLKTLQFISQEYIFFSNVLVLTLHVAINQ